MYRFFLQEIWGLCQRESSKAIFTTRTHAYQYILTARLSGMSGRIWPNKQASKTSHQTSRWLAVKPNMVTN